VDEAVLVEVLRDGTLAGAAMDVFATEPVPPDHPLLSLENFLCTPTSGPPPRRDRSPAPTSGPSSSWSTRGPATSATP
jgi:hypothetical protein